MDNITIFSKDHLIQGLEKLNIPYTQTQIDLCEQFYKEYLCKMDVLNISTIQNPNDFIQKHILDSLVAYPWIIHYKDIADLGSGGGFPGIILGIFLPREISITLIDVVEKKVQYLKDLIKHLDLPNVLAYNASKAKVPGNFDLIVSRAVGSLSKIVLYSKPYLKSYTKILAYKGKEETIEKEILEIKNNILVQVNPVSVPFLDAERHIVILKNLKS